MFDLMKILTSEATSAEAAVETAKKGFAEMLQRPEVVTASQMEALAYAQAYCSEVMVFWIIAKKYESDREVQLTKLQARYRWLVEDLAADYGVCSTSPWANAADMTRRKARVNLMHKLGGILS